ncbi:glycosyltransferase family 2 protein [Schleiferilactobacillus harbinensis]|jgi:cellulose synthase/poly-beta-1,6-N-acetylglucosamine synthase-like glycosyltransferase|uniref:glycosyltransferase family 2 protein n=1 Tax=Schleiferilactobacillus harbinensis TaxID=304207 RepID=UPI00242D1758|nr:glycosyltransferase family 2 protein [Schleiferilactobacillus harbinensis]MCI1688294.1 glycosyltransferase family 2 protein [Schleiferilactobacillus harbinensis]MCI1782244.1 glycosyltransferase family 2 protein [Schleiferilactobacillus harbinensis]MCI1850111.1 glycosyltransferase family 2 protein [Schleiferilactobacillus harbinensis]
MIKHWSRLDFGALAIYLLVVIGGPIAILASIADSFAPFIQHFGWFLFLLVISISTWVLLLTMYYIFLTIFGFGRARRDYPLAAPRSRFLVLIPAHNEEAVLGATLANLKQIDYPRALYRIVVISDQSTDETAAIARQFGAQVIDTNRRLFRRVGVGKPAALQYGLDTLANTGQLRAADYVLVLDADNFADTSILRELNSQFLAKPYTAIQAYLDSKNDDRLLSLGYAMSYWTMNRFFQLSKYRLGLDNSIGGTGFAVNVDWLVAHDGFQSRSLTEDLEMEIRIVESGGSVGWNHWTRIYDEKPEHLRASMVQRYRWSRGHWYTAFHNVGPLLAHFFKSGDVRYLDQINYLFSMRQNIQYLLALIFALGWGISWVVPQGGAYPMWLADVERSYFVPMTLINWAILLEGFLPMIAGYWYDAPHRLAQLPKALVAFYWFSLTYLADQLVGLATFPNQQTWSHTRHALTTPHRH